jgi:hypothetical protein
MQKPNDSDPQILKHASEGNGSVGLSQGGPLGGFVTWSGYTFSTARLHEGGDPG